MNYNNLRNAALFVAATSMVGVSMRPAEAKIFDKVRFVADLGIAYYCFHHWVSTPYRNGAFTAGAPHRTGTIVKAGVALLFALHEVKSANKIAHHSKDPLLQGLASKLDAVEGSVGSIGSKFHSGQFKPNDMSNLSSNFGSFDSAARAGGLDIKDKSVPVPGL